MKIELRQHIISPIDSKMLGTDIDLPFVPFSGLIIHVGNFHMRVDRVEWDDGTLRAFSRPYYIHDKDHIADDVRSFTEKGWAILDE